MELKWFTSNRDWCASRLDILQDAYRLTTCTVVSPNCRFLVLGGAEARINSLFDKAHQKVAREQKRTMFAGLFARTVGAVNTADWATISALFPDAASRMPQGLIAGTPHGFRVKCLAAEDMEMEGSKLGSVYVWQVDKKPGPAPGAGP